MEKQVIYTVCGVFRSRFSAYSYAPKSFIDAEQAKKEYHTLCSAVGRNMEQVLKQEKKLTPDKDRYVTAYQQPNSDNYAEICLYATYLH
jgi:hypothetical protein